MNSTLNWVRRRQRTLTRAVLALFCLAWLQAAVAPCAMAGAAFATMPAGGHHCPYCPQGDSMPSNTDHGGACAYPHQPQVDARATAIFAAIPVCSITFIVGAIERDLEAPVTATAEPAQRVPIALSFCRFLE